MKTDEYSWVEFTEDGLTIETEYDSCVDSNTLLEWYCFGTAAQNISITCSDTCSGGMCVSATTSTSTTTSTTTTASTTTLPGTHPLTVTRSLPDGASAGSQLTVTMTMDINESDAPETVGIIETPPEGWEILSTEPAGSLTSNPGSIEWLFWELGNPVEDRDITYTLSVPSDADGTYDFSGTFDYALEIKPPIVGDSELLVESCSINGDYPPCGEVTLSEVIDFITVWSEGGTSLDDVIDLITAWAASD